MPMTSENKGLLMEGSSHHESPSARSIAGGCGVRDGRSPHNCRQRSLLVTKRELETRRWRDKRRVVYRFAGYKLFRLETMAFLLTVFLVCCSLVSTEGQECGANPLEDMMIIADKTNRELKDVLLLMKKVDEGMYEAIKSQFYRYATCIGLVDAGYFKKRDDPEMRKNTEIFTPRDESTTTNHSPPDNNEKLKQDLGKSLYIYNWLTQARRDGRKSSHSDYGDTLSDFFNS